jgi:hypothetical protein
MTFTFTEEMMKEALLANGWYELFVADNWVERDNKHPDYAGISRLSAFKILLRKVNLI